MSKLLLGFIIGLLIAVPATVLADGARDHTMNASYDNNNLYVTRYDDDKYQVKCWVKDDSRGGISCLPWAQVKERR